MSQYTNKELEDVFLKIQKLEQITVLRGATPFEESNAKRRIEELKNKYLLEETVTKSFDEIDLTVKEDEEIKNALERDGRKKTHKYEGPNIIVPIVDKKTHQVTFFVNEHGFNSYFGAMRYISKKQK